MLVYKSLFTILKCAVPLHDSTDFGDRNNQGDQKNVNKFAQILEKVAQTVAKAKNVKISPSKLNLNVQNKRM